MGRGQRHSRQSSIVPRSRRSISSGRNSLACGELRQWSCCVMGKRCSVRALWVRDMPGSGPDRLFAAYASQGCGCCGERCVADASAKLPRRGVPAEIGGEVSGGRSSVVPEIRERNHFVGAGGDWARGDRAGARAEWRCAEANLRGRYARRPGGARPGGVARPVRPRQDECARIP